MSTPVAQRTASRHALGMLLGALYLDALQAGAWRIAQCLVRLLARVSRPQQPFSHSVSHPRSFVSHATSQVPCQSIASGILRFRQRLVRNVSLVLASFLHVRPVSRAQLHLTFRAPPGGVLRTASRAPTGGSCTLHADISHAVPRAQRFAGPRRRFISCISCAPTRAASCA